MLRRFVVVVEVCDECLDAAECVEGGVERERLTDEEQTLPSLQRSQGERECRLDHQSPLRPRLHVLDVEISRRVLGLGVEELTESPTEYLTTGVGERPDDERRRCLLRVVLRRLRPLAAPGPEREQPSPQGSRPSRHGTLVFSCGCENYAVVTYFLHGNRDYEPSDGRRRRPRRVRADAHR